MRVLWLFWELQDRLGEVHTWAGQLLPTADTLDPQARAELVWTAAVTAVEVGDDPAALSARQRLGPLLDGIDDPFLRALCQQAMAWTATIVDDLDGALREASVSLGELRGQDAPFWTASAGITLGSLETTVGRYDDALGHLTEVRDLAERFDNAWLGAMSRVFLATLALVRGLPEEAKALLDEALGPSLAAHSTRGVTLCLAAFARWAFVAGDPERAALVAGAAEGLRRRAGLRAWPILRQGEAKLVAQVRQALGDRPLRPGVRRGHPAHPARRGGRGQGPARRQHLADGVTRERQAVRWAAPACHGRLCGRSRTPRCTRT